MNHQSEPQGPGNRETLLSNGVLLFCVLILAVEPGSSAARAGLRPTTRNAFGSITLGDIITAVDDQSIVSTNDFLDILEKHQPGDQVTLTVLRDKQPTKIQATLDTAE